MPARNRYRKNPKNRNQGAAILPVTRGSATEAGEPLPGSDEAAAVETSACGMESTSQIEPDQPADKAVSPDSPSSPAVPEEMAKLLADLLTRQRHWQQQQSQSEQLIARLADQLDQSQRMIESLVANNLSADKETPRATDDSLNGHHEPENEDPFSWEQQKKKLLQGESGEPGPAAMTLKPVQTNGRQNNESPSAVTTTACPSSLSLESLIEHELSLLDESEQARRVRWLRERLEERLREAEIEISIERAKLIRERRELENNRMDFEATIARGQNSPARGVDQDAGSRWMRFLGR